MSSQVIYQYTRSTGEAVVFTLIPGRTVLVHIDNEIVEERDITVLLPRFEGNIDAAALRFAKNWQDSDKPTEEETCSSSK